MPNRPTRQAIPCATFAVYALALFGVPAFAADGVTLELMASPGFSKSSLTGHAFMCIGLQVSSGIKEECFGFYPQKDNIKGYVGGPGVVNSEFQKNPGRFSLIDQSFEVSIDLEQRRAILTLVNQWNSAGYALASQQCVDFIRSVAQAANLNIPPRINEFPSAFLARLKHLNPSLPGLWTSSSGAYSGVRWEFLANGTFRESGGAAGGPWLGTWTRTGGNFSVKMNQGPGAAHGHINENTLSGNNFRGVGFVFDKAQ